MAIIGIERLFLVLALVDENLIALQYDAGARHMVYPCMYIHSAATTNRYTRRNLLEQQNYAGNECTMERATRRSPLIDAVSRTSLMIRHVFLVLVHDCLGSSFTSLTQTDNLLKPL